MSTTRSNSDRQMGSCDEEQQARLDTLERRREQRAIHQANYHSRCIAIEGQQAVETKDRLKSLKYMSKTLANPELRAQQNLQARNKEKKRLQNGGAKKAAGKHRGKKNPDFRYPGRLRKKMKQAVYVQMNMYGFKSLYRNHIIELLDGIRKHYTGNDDEMYYACEYKRCISAFLKQDEGKHLLPKDDRFKLSEEKMAAALKVRSSMKSKEFRAHVLKVCLDETKMKQEKAFSDGIPFGTV